MRKYAEFVKEAGPYPGLIDKEYSWWAYKQGESKAFTNKRDAHKFSKLVDMVWENVDLWQASMNACNEYSQKIYDAWYAELRNSKSSMPDKVFDIFFKKAEWFADEADGDDNPNDRLAEYLEELVEFFNSAYAVWDD
jgi:dsDNA-binding SOS-regulon protein